MKYKKLPPLKEDIKDSAKTNAGEYNKSYYNTRTKAQLKVIKDTGNVLVIKTNKFRQYSMDDITLTVKTILNHKYASTKQKESVEKAFKLLNETWCSKSVAYDAKGFINSVKMQLMKKANR